MFVFKEPGETKTVRVSCHLKTKQTKSHVRFSFECNIGLENKAKTCFYKNSPNKVLSYSVCLFFEDARFLLYMRGFYDLATSLYLKNTPWWHCPQSFVDSRASNVVREELFFLIFLLGDMGGPLHGSSMASQKLQREGLQALWRDLQPGNIFQKLAIDLSCRVLKPTKPKQNARLGWEKSELQRLKV